MQYIKKIQGEFNTNVTDDVKYVSRVTGEIQREDYINLNGFIGYMQNFSRIEMTSALPVPLSFGLTNNQDITMITLEISY